MMGTVRRVCRNVKRWRNAAMALRWTSAGLMEAAKGFRRWARVALARRLAILLERIWKDKTHFDAVPA
jgi:hypothetical protein